MVGRRRDGLGAMVAPAAACENLERLTRTGVEGRFGMYEAIDYTPARLAAWPDLLDRASFMAHHQGMSLLAMAYAARPADAEALLIRSAVQATALLLQETVEGGG